MKSEASFAQLVESIQTTHRELSAQAGRAINISLTLRNWLIGYYIAEYELNGRDRAEYGAALLKRLSIELSRRNMVRCAERELRRYRQFYLIYPQIRDTLSTELTRHLNVPMNLGDTDSRITPVPSTPVLTPAKTLLSELSFSHIVELIAIDNSTKRAGSGKFLNGLRGLVLIPSPRPSPGGRGPGRGGQRKVYASHLKIHHYQRAFYEVECIRGNWSVRELKRQIGSLYYERFGLSRDKTKLSELAHQHAETKTALDIRDPYIFEFLGLKPVEVMSGSRI